MFQVYQLFFLAEIQVFFTKKSHWMWSLFLRSRTIIYFQHFFFPPFLLYLPCPWPAVGLSLPIAILKGEDSGSGTDLLPGALWWRRQRLRAEAPNSAEWPPRAGAPFSEANHRMRF